MASEIRGELVLDDRGCLRVRDGGTDSLVIWPAGFGVKRTDGELRVIDGEGEGAARVGQEIYAGGGEVPSASAVGQTRRELRERCPGPYWIAAPPVRTSPQEKR